MARRKQTDSSDKRHKDGSKEDGKQWHRVFRVFCLMPCPRARQLGLFAWSTSGFLSGFYRRVGRLLAKVETVQRADGTRWHGSMRLGWRGEEWARLRGWWGGDHILLQSGNKTGQSGHAMAPCLSSRRAIKRRGHGSATGCGGRAPCWNRQSGRLTWEEYFMCYWSKPSNCSVMPDIPFITALICRLSDLASPAFACGCNVQSFNRG